MLLWPVKFPWYAIYHLTSLPFLTMHSGTLRLLSRSSFFDSLAICLCICPTVQWRPLCDVGVYCNQHEAAFRAISPGNTCVCVSIYVCVYVYMCVLTSVRVCMCVIVFWRPSNNLAYIKIKLQCCWNFNYNSWFGPGNCNSYCSYNSNGKFHATYTHTHTYIYINQLNNRHQRILKFLQEPIFGMCTANYSRCFQIPK